MLCIPEADMRGSLEIDAGSGMWVATPVTVCPPTRPVPIILLNLPIILF